MRKLCLFACLLMTSINLFSQSAFLQRNSDMYYMLDRYDVLSGRLSDTLQTALNPLSQKDAVRFLETYATTHKTTLSKIEQWEINRFISKNGEWGSHGDATKDSKYPIFKTIYAKQPNFYSLLTKDYSIVMNPVIYYQQSFESKNTKQNLFVNTKGIEVRGNIGKRVGFYTMFSDNQERGPWSHQMYVAYHNAIPGVTYYKPFKLDKPGLAQDYLVASGYVDACFLKEKINVTFGNSRFHLGDGYRSLFLSDFGSNYNFLRLNTRLGRFNYQNLFLELTPQYVPGADQVLPRKYAAIHHLSMNVNRWLNIGLFESVIYSRKKNQFEFGYLNPIILYRSVEQSNGSPDNAMLGLNFKINTKIRSVIYGQILIDEFRFDSLKSNTGWWGNKYALQLGLKIADPVGIKNLLIQPELNIIRPFTYSYKDSIADFSHYNQSMAHPFGANLMELSLNVHYKPAKKIYVSWRSFYNKQGRDTSSAVSFGGNIFKPYQNRSGESGIFMFNGYSSAVLYSNLNMSYELRDNFFLDAGISYRLEDATHEPNPTRNSMLLSVGFRLNAARRQYDY